MRIFNWNSLDKAGRTAALARPFLNARAEATRVAAGVIERVRREGDAALLALTPISAFRPRRWHGALLSHRARVRFEVRESAKRPVSAVADDFEVRDVSAVDVAEDRSIAMTMLYDAGHNLDERILTEQFSD